MLPDARATESGDIEQSVVSKDLNIVEGGCLLLVDERQAITN